MRKLLIVLVFLISCDLTSQNRKRLDSLLVIEKQFKTDTTGIKNLISISKKLRKLNYDSSLLYANKAIALSQKINTNYFYFESYYNKCLTIKSSGNFKILSDSLLKLYQDPRIIDFPGIRRDICLDMGVNYRKLSNFNKSIKYLLESLALAKKINYKISIYNSYNSLANTYSQIGNVKKSKLDMERALEYYDMAMNYIDTADLKSKGSVLNNQGVTFFNIAQVVLDSNMFLKAIDYQKKSLRCREILKDSIEMVNNYSNIGNSYHGLSGLLNSSFFSEKCFFNYEKAIEIAKKLKLPELYIFIQNYSGHLSAIAKKTNDKKLALKAIDYFKESLKTSLTNGDNYATMITYEGLAVTYSDFKMNDSSVKYYIHLLSLKDTILNEENKQISEDLATKYESDLKDTENKNLINQAELREEVISRKSNTIKLMVIGSMLLFGLAILVLISRQKITKSRALIQKHQLETEKQKHIIEEKNKEIIDSINYAKRLQDAAIPSKDYFNSLFPNSFIYYQPKDIVAGDFYWVHKLKNQNQILVTAADCTGHGVPGALVSIVCLNALNRCVEEFGLTQPNAILNKTTEIIQQSFRQGENDVKDGMDISLVLLDLDSYTGLFAGANNPLWIVKKNEIIELKGDNQPVGKQHKPSPFNQHEFKIEKEDLLILFTDGYIDQFGGPNGKKLKTKTFKEQLLAISPTESSQIFNSVKDTFTNWKGNLEQVDDVLIIGIRLK